MDWKNIINNINEIKDVKLDDYKLLNVNDLTVMPKGSHIKYIKKVDGVDKVLNGGFLIDIIDINKPIYTYLILKSNIIWKLRYCKYKIYIKENKNFNNNNNIKKTLYNFYKDEIKEKQQELLKKYLLK
jgi:hypothetical protein